MKYERVIQYVLETPWAIRPVALGAIIDILAARADGRTFTAEELADRIGAAQVAQRQPRKAGAVAVLPLYGSIFPRANLFTEMSGGTSLQKWSSEFRSLDASGKVAHIVMDIASPGGSVELVPETGEIIRNAETPVTAVANAEAASAAYWLAAQADEIVVTPSGQVGSIGVWTAHDDFSRMDKNKGIETTLIKAGKHKIDANPWEPLGEDARADLQAMVDIYYDMFTAAVATGRGVSVAVAAGERFGEGKMFTAEDAVRRGMADRVATLYDVITELTSGGASPAKAVLVGDGAAQEELAEVMATRDDSDTSDDEIHLVVQDDGSEDEDEDTESEPAAETVDGFDITNRRHRKLAATRREERIPSSTGGDQERRGQ